MVSLEAIEKITQAEQDCQARKAEAEAEARRIVTEAEQNGLALLQQARAAAAEEGKLLIKQAEDRAAQQAAQIARTAQDESVALQDAAGKNLDQAADFIVGRVVKH